ncbi:phosphoglycolate phosphatase [Mariprofundus ferrinatatus]|uniref:Phosphoglycolate phosphatase n=1 Tax=Mariprofundus ferrinatatus TaxID=1921087 RepID=A0A2K8LC10_9PROT|nr:HAD-IA family hydrolase [Mariprofundus ferrinatatus]ATX82444.1 phosphoglycolate phosphatase [Mariprofundus ferrinatatus]
MILFDCDGTLTDSHGAIVEAMQQAFENNGIAKPDAECVNRIIGLSLREAVRRLLPESSDEALQEQVRQGYRESYRIAEQQITLYPGVREVLDELKLRGYWLGVVTGKSHPGLLRVLENFNLRDYFYVIRTADCTHSKPHPAMVSECMVEMGVRPEQTTVVGDALYDVQMARAAGVRCIGVSFGVGESEALLQAGAECVVDDFFSLLDHFPPLP